MPPFGVKTALPVLHGNSAAFLLCILYHTNGIRSVVGLDKTEAKNAFAKIADEANFNHKQMQFVNLIIDYFSENGVVEIKQLMEYPFKDIDTRGIIQLFGNEKVE